MAAELKLDRLARDASRDEGWLQPPLRRGRRGLIRSFLIMVGGILIIVGALIVQGVD